MGNAANEYYLRQVQQEEECVLFCIAAKPDVQFVASCGCGCLCMVYEVHIKSLAFCFCMLNNAEHF